MVSHTLSNLQLILGRQIQNAALPFIFYFSSVDLIKMFAKPFSNFEVHV